MSNDKLLKIRNQKNGIVVSTMESSKYISGYKLEQINDTIVGVDIYTTSIYNVFSDKISVIDIILDKDVKIIMVAGNMMQRNKLASDDYREQEFGGDVLSGNLNYSIAVTLFLKTILTGTGLTNYL
ncbi:hypothetical protein [Deminuibacter soli]|uniref:Uncharacterized protein n=1 Tax=Deminuibacter soli TaxID=2291815 RepID=A0A3E1NGA6_9BACT|nr:hypothetical protein [Deminuibacter soli]RFM26912.1 hypothetical protein DXN05_18175 [Deminuibacter soli]